MTVSRTTTASRAEKLELLNLLEKREKKKAGSSLKKFARSIIIPGAPINDSVDCEKFYPDRVSPAVHHDLIMDGIQAMIDGVDKVDGLMILMPPGSAKSTYASVVFPPYFMGRFPLSNIIMTTYGSDLAQKFGRKCRQIVRSKEYAEIFETKISGSNSAVDDWSLENESTYMCGGILSGITGNRADVLLIDDPVKGREEADSETIRRKIVDAYRDDLCTRLKPNGKKILIQTRWHEDDLAGQILPENYAGESGIVIGKTGERWRVICLQAQCTRQDDPLGRKVGEYLWTEWFDEGFWEKTKRNQSVPDSRGWLSLYQQTPTTDEGIYFKREWIKRYRIGDEPRSLTKYGASDYAVTEGGGDYTDQGIAGFDRNEDLWILDWWSGQTTADHWIDAQIGMAEKHDPLAWVAEGGPIRRAVEPFLLKRQQQKSCYYRLEWLTSNNDKATNARVFQALCSQGKVWIPNCQWGDELIAQLMQFPAGKHDDKVDVCGLFGRILDQTFAPSEIAQITEKKKHDYGFNETDDEEGNWKLA